MLSRKYKVLRADRACRVALNVGDTIYDGRDCYGCASDDTRMTGIEHKSFSVNESGEPFFTMPRADAEQI